MPDCTPSDYWPLILAYVLPPVGAVLSAIALWVAARARSISVDGLSTSQAAVTLSMLHGIPPESTATDPAATDPPKS
jgi:hypothetical protein